MNGFNLLLFFTHVLPMILFSALYLTGLILAIVRRKRHPQVSVLAGIFFLARIIWSIGWLVAIITIYYVNNGQGAEEFARSQAFPSVVDLVFSVVLFIIMLYAIYGWRGQKLPPLSEILTQK